MQLSYHNIMEDLVAEAFDSMKKSFSVCSCPRCRNDIIAYALNQLKPHYVVSTVGAAMVKLDHLRIQQSADIIAALTQAITLVSEHPRHDQQQ